MAHPELTGELEQLHRAAFGWALHCCAGDQATAEDVLQASYLKILDGRARFAGRSTFQTWVFGIVRRTAAEERRRAAVRRWIPLSLAGEPSTPTTGATDRLVRSEEARGLAAALAALPARQREVLHLVFYEELTIEAAAEILGVAVGTARTHYERGKAALRRQLPRGDR
jgi:RNA polymerase sigma-70 factor (ECF subfamily)